MDYDLSWHGNIDETLYMVTQKPERHTSGNKGI